MARKRSPAPPARPGPADDSADDSVEPGSLAEPGDEQIDIAEAPDPINATPEQVRKYNNRSVERVVSMLNVLQESSDAMSLVEISRSIDMAKATAFRYLWTLERNRYVERDPKSGHYRLGLGFVGMQSRPLEVLQERARPWLEKLRDDTQETSNLGILEGDTIVYLDGAESPRGVRMARPRGSRDQLYCTALGKAIAAHLPEQQVREILSRVDMSPMTPNTITSVDEYMAQLVTVRQRGYAIDDAENDADGRCVAAPILGTRLPAALSISGPASRFPIEELERVAKLLIEVADRLSVDPATRKTSDSAG